MINKHEHLFNGDRSEAMVMAAFVAKGIYVAKPFENSCPYDLIIDYKNRLCRIQIKTGWIESRNKTLVFKPSSTYINGKKHGQVNSYKGKKIKYYAVYYHGKKKVFLIPRKNIKNNKTLCSLRFKKPKNNQSENIRYAKDYLFYDFNSD